MTKAKDPTVTAATRAASCTGKDTSSTIGASQQVLEGNLAADELDAVCN